MALTLGHEAFIHAIGALNELVGAIDSGDLNKIQSAYEYATEDDHVRYLMGGKFGGFGTFLKQLDLPNDVKQRLIEEHDQNLENHTGVKSRRNHE